MRRSLLALSLAVTSSACSFLAFDDFTDSSGLDASTEAGADAATADALTSPTTDATTDGAPAETGPPDPYGDVVRVDAPVAWFRFEESVTEVDAKDSAGAHTGKLVSGPMGFGATGISGRGISTPATGTPAGFSLGNVLGFDGTKSFSLEVWVKPAPRPGGHYLFTKRESASGSGFNGWLLYLLEVGTPRFENWGTDLFAAGTSPIPSGWVHIVATVAFDGATSSAKMFVNGLLQPTATAAGNQPTPATSVPLEILSKFLGDADELAIYDKALSAERIVAHYEAGKP
jgi:hypothetical protein